MSIEELTGIALGCIGLRLDDFEALTPKEFAATYRQWRLRQDALSHERWETNRMSGMLAMMPWMSKNKSIRMNAVISFPWETSAPEESPNRAIEKSTEERFEELKKRWA